MVFRMLVALAALVALAGAAVPGPQDEDPFAVLDGLFAPWDRDDGPGLSVALIVDGTMAYERGFGMANLEHAIPNTPDTIFRIGSTSKQFTAACIALLSLRGELDLDADVRTILRELPEWEHAVTVRHMVHHVSGIPDYVGLLAGAGHELEDHTTPEDTLKILVAVEGLQFEPGSRFQYSNSNYFLLGAVVRRVSGKSLRAFAEENIFGPLGMTDTHYHDRYAEVVPRRADGYRRSPFGPGWAVHNTTWEQVGDGGVFTTVRDLARWDAFFYDHSLLADGAALHALMHTRGVLNDGTEIEYAFGLGVGEEQGRRVVAHAGGWVGFVAEMMRWPDDRVTVIVLSNDAGSVRPSALAKSMAAVLF